MRRFSTQAQLAAAIAQAWPVTPAYRVTQPGRRVQALRTWRRCVRIFRARREGICHNDE